MLTKKKDPEKNNRTAQEVFLRILHCNSSLMNAFLFEVIWGISNHFFLKLGSKLW